MQTTTQILRAAFRSIESIRAGRELTQREWSVRGDVFAAAYRNYTEKGRDMAIVRYNESTFV